MKKFKQLLLTALAVLCSTLTTWAAYDGKIQYPEKITADNYINYGFTTDNWQMYENYYGIRSAAELYGFSSLVNGGTASAKGVLTADIVVNENVLNDDGTLNGTPTYSWRPIGTRSKSFKGTFDGNGHTISGLYFSSTTDKDYPNGGNYVGLTGFADGAEIKNVGVIGSYIKGCKYVSGICGYAIAYTLPEYNTTITNCYNTGTVSATSYFGAICQYGGTVINCYYLEGCCSVSGGGVSATAEEFANGKVTYLLNGSTSEGNLVWYQTLGDGGDAYPVFDNTHGVVYATHPCTSEFRNTEGEKEHPSMDVTGHCTACGQFIVQEPTSVTESNYGSLNLTADFVDYYAISNSSELYWFADFVNNVEPNANAVLTADIVVNETVLKANGTINGTPTYSWTPIGTSTYKYTGTFDGNGHTISGLYFNKTANSDYPVGGNNVGLIGYADGATIKNIGIIDSYLKGYNYVGGICGYGSNTNTNITNCYNTGTISGSEYVGGINGRKGTQTNCYNAGAIWGYNWYAGGICGFNGNQTNCYNTGTVWGSSSFVGGICGSGGTQTICYNTGTVTSSSSYVGGICGNYGTQTNCYYLEDCCSSGGGGVSATAEEFANGKVTYLLNGSTSEGNLAWYQTLGNGGDAYPVFDNTHAVVYVSQPCTSEISNTNGAVKEHSSMDATGRCTACGKFLAQEPTLVTESNYSSFNLTADFIDYYAISNVSDLYWFADLVNSSNTNLEAKAVLTADIFVNEYVLNADGTLNGTPTYSWTPIGTSTFKYAGTFDGNGHTISGLYFNNTTNGSSPNGGIYVGLIGNADGATIKNVGVIDSYIQGYMYVGGICGNDYSYSNTKITNCHYMGTVTGSSDYVGGICGYYGIQTNCYYMGTVTGSSYYVGGICGYGGTQINCYNTGTVSGSSYVGGISGISGTQTNCYNIGTVSGSSACVGGICGSGGNRTNCYYLAGCAKDGNNVSQYGIGNNTSGSTTDDMAGKTTSATTVDFANGKIAYLLNGSTSEDDLAWYQTLGDAGDAYPVLDNTHGVVYASQPCVSFVNTPGVTVDHVFENGRCTVCGECVCVDGVYQLANADHLYWFAGQVNGGRTDIKAVLTADIVVNENVLNAEGELNGDGTDFETWTPIGTYTNQYAGTFDGNGHTISGLYFNNTTNDNYPNGGEFVGLIGYANGAKIKNVGVIDSYISGYYYVGGICGYGYGSYTTIINCYNTGTVSGSYYIGGISGTGGTQVNCYNTGKVSGISCVGGICGGGGTQTNCYYLEDCGSNTLGVSATAEEFASGKITYLLNGTAAEPVWYQTIGENADASPTLNRSHSVVYVTHPCQSGFSNTEGQVKEHSCNRIGYCSVCESYAQPATLVTEENCNELGLPNHIGYYAIANAGQLYWFTNWVSDGHYGANAVLTADIVVNDHVLNADGSLNGTPTYEWIPIGQRTSNGYMGTFDGNNHTISGLYYYNVNGLASLISDVYGARIKNVGVVDSYFYGRFAAGICGTQSRYGSSSITNCYSKATVVGEYAGGICGYWGYEFKYGGDKPSEIKYCYNTGVVIGLEAHVGGICGQIAYENMVTTTSCYYLKGCAKDANNVVQNGVGASSIGRTTRDRAGVSYALASSFAGGSVGVSLNANGNNVWYQTLFSDESPVLNATHNNITGYVTENENVINVRGNLIVATNYEISEGKTLLIPADASVTTTGNAVITNNGTIIANGSIAGNDIAGNGSFIYNELGADDVTITTPSVTYIGTELTLDNNVRASFNTRTFCGKTFTFDNSLTSVSYENNRNVGDNATVTWTNTNGSFVSKTFSITPKTLTISNIKAEGKTYDGNAETTVSYTADVFDDDDVTFGTAATFNNKNVGTSKAVSFNYTKSGADAANYAFVNESGSTTANIEPRELAISSVSAAGKEYDGNTTTTVAIVASNIISDDVVTFGTAAAFDDKNVGTNKTVNFTYTKSGADAANYSFAQANGTATAAISARELTLSNFVAADKVYDGTVAGSGSFSDDRVSGDVLEFSYTVEFDDENANTDIDVYFSNIAISGGADKDNYYLDVDESEPKANADITPVTDEVVVTIAMPTRTVVYSGHEGRYAMPEMPDVFSWNSNLYNLSAVAPTDMAEYQATLQNIQQKTDVGEYSLGWNNETFVNVSPNFTNVSFSVTDGKLIITPKTGVVVTITEKSGELTYNTEEQKVEGYSVDIEDETGIFAETDIAFSGNAVVAGTTVGSYAMELSAADFSNTNANFAEVTFNIVDGALTITKAPEAPNKPEAEMETRYINTQLVALPADWAWSENKALEMGTNTATTNYTGADKGNYETESVEVNITRLECLHNEGNDILYTLDPTCTHKGYTGNTSCKLCGQIYEMGDSIPALGHDFVNTVIAPTCTTDGYTEHLCSRCQHLEYSDTIAATGHKADSVEFENVVAATCTAAGSRDSVVYCSVCQIELSREEVVIPATGHEAGAAVAENLKAATCTEAGSVDSVVYCTVCKEELNRKTVVIEATGHKAGAAVAENLKAATCTEAGSVDSVVYCTACKEELSRKTVVIEPTGHKAGAAVAENLKEATCTAAGSVDSVVYCTVCKAELSRKTVELPATGHTEVVDAAVAATCTESGLTEGSHCSVCNAIIKAQEVIPATGHKADSIVIENVVAATYTAAGSYDSVVYCSVCKVELSRTKVEVPQLVAPKVDAEVVISQIEYTVGDSLKLDGGKLIITTSDSTTAEIVITPDMIKGFNPDSVGVQQVTVEFTVNNVVYTTTFEVEVKEAVVIEVVAKSVALSAPTKVVYKKGEQLDVAGGKLTVTYSDGTTQDVDLKADMVSGFDAEKVGAQQLTVMLKIGEVVLTATFDVTVEADDNTAISDDEAAAVNIYAYQNVIVVESADALEGEISIFDVNGRMVAKELAAGSRTEIMMQQQGIYIVKVNNTAKRVMVY